MEEFTEGYEVEQDLNEQEFEELDEAKGKKNWIQKAHIQKGGLHRDLGIDPGKKIPASKLAIKKTDSPQLKKRKQFAQNMRSMRK